MCSLSVTDRTTRLMAAAAVVLVLGACSSDDGAGSDDGGGATTVESMTDPDDPATDVSPDPEAGTGGEGSTDDADPGDGDATEAPDEDEEEVEPTLPEIGVPGLDDDEVVCRAWSRFAGSFQVAAVAASFGGDPIGAAVLEVSASPVIAAAVVEMFEAWPDELADEAELVADRYLGPFARRSARALDELIAAGADDEQLDRIAVAWLDSLARRDPAEVLPDLVLDDDLADLVEAAAVTFAAEVVPIPVDPSLITDVEIPLTQEFIVETCPDRGTLAGGEVEASD